MNLSGKKNGSLPLNSWRGMVGWSLGAVDSCIPEVHHSISSMGIEPGGHRE